MPAKAILKGLAATVAFFASCYGLTLLFQWVNDPMWILGAAGFVWVWFFAAMHFNRR